MSAKLPNFTKQEFENLKQTEKLVFVDFWATWCPPCKFMTPIFENLSTDEEIQGLEFYQCDVDVNNDVAADFRITSIPTFIIMKFSGDGSFDPEKNIVKKFVGGKDGITFKQEVVEAIESLE